ncbi:hypothetical protein AMATHDRAFT_153824, partial [Amanita thiersii Skay4041]
QMQNDAPCLHYPENLGIHREVTLEYAISMLTRATTMALNVPFSWGFIDKPTDGQLLLLFIPPQNSFPNDGIRYLEPEVKYSKIVGNARELEIHEVKSGFIPGSQEPMATRARRRYRFIKGGHPQLILVHYTRGPPAQIPPMANQPVRQYPLRVINEPSVYVMGEKAGQKVFTPGAGGPGHPSPMHGGGPPMPVGAGGMGPLGMPFNAQAMVAQQNSNMELLERRRERERMRESASVNQARQQQQRMPDEDDSMDEAEQVSTRSLAMTRYRRNHDLMNEVFMHAAYDQTLQQRQQLQPHPYSIFDKTELEANLVRSLGCSLSHTS